MKKSLVLGAAALAAVMMAVPEQSEASEIKVGGYYMFRVQDQDNIVTDIAGEDDISRYVHRLQLNADFIHDKKTHAHIQTRILDSQDVEGLNATSGADWSVRSVWLETEMWGVGLKVGQMPLSLNDNILISTQSTAKGFGTLMLSKNFGNVTVLLGNVKVDEGNASEESVNDDKGYFYDSDGDGDINTGTVVQSTYGADEDDIDLYFLSLLGKASQVDYNVTAAYWDSGDDATFTTDDNGTQKSYTSGSYHNVIPGQDVNNVWLALTLQGNLGGVTATGTAIYEDGFDGAGNDEEDGSLFALRLKGKAPIGEWNAYGFWADENFDNIVNHDMKWSKAWDMGGTGSKDLLNTWAKNATGMSASDSENMAGVGAGLKIKAGAWTINPQLDYASVDEDAAGYSDSAWGGTLALSTKINKATSLSLTGVYVDPDDGDDNGDTAGGNEFDSMHYLEASVKMKF